MSENGCSTELFWDAPLIVITGHKTQCRCRVTTGCLVVYRKNTGSNFKELQDTHRTAYPRLISKLLSSPECTKFKHLSLIQSAALAVCNPAGCSKSQALLTDPAVKWTNSINRHTGSFLLVSYHSSAVLFSTHFSNFRQFHRPNVTSSTYPATVLSLYQIDICTHTQCYSSIHEQTQMSWVKFNVPLEQFRSLRRRCFTGPMTQPAVPKYRHSLIQPVQFKADQHAHCPINSLITATWYKMWKHFGSSNTKQRL